MPLSLKEEKFCQHYVKCLNKTKAALSAGYSKKSARGIGYENSTKPHIQARITEIQTELKETSGITAHAVIMELATLGFWNIKDFIGENNLIKDLSKMPKSKLKPVIGIEIRETITTIENQETKEIATKLKMADKRGALVDLGRHLGIFEEDNKQKAIKIKVTRK